MNAKFKKWLLSLLVLQLFLPVHVVIADTGPKPSMEFEFEQGSSTEPLEVISSILYECDEADCSDAAPLEELGPQRFSCNADGCYAIAYGFAPYHRIKIEFSDGSTRQSNIFETIDFDSVYLVTVNADDLSVVEVSGSPAPLDEPFFPAPTPVPNVYLGVGLFACICLSFLLFIGLVIFFARRSRKK
ncbi:MAG TPA: hypothetical protein VJ785_06210 [Anaerolineales bacterium]|nr:hypothetical protein [Anaerolineales bacterium]